MSKGVIPNNDTVADTVEQSGRGYGDHDPDSDGGATEADGDLKRDFREEKLMHTVIQPTVTASTTAGQCEKQRITTSVLSPLKRRLTR